MSVFPPPAEVDPPPTMSDLKLFKLWLPESIWFISAVAFLEDNFRNRDVFRLLSSRRLLDRGLAATDRRAIFIACGSRRRPPVLIEVVSKAVKVKYF